MALMLAGCGDKDDSATEAEKAAEPESAVVVEEAEVVIEPADGDAPEVVEEAAEEVRTGE
jgi:uncharacterized lipoprotein YajG